MKKHACFLNAVILGTAMVTVGLSGSVALADNSQGQDNNSQGQDTTLRPQPSYRVPESSSLILLGAGLAGVGIWAWRRKST